MITFQEYMPLHAQLVLEIAQKHNISLYLIKRTDTITFGRTRDYISTFIDDKCNIKSQNSNIKKEMIAEFKTMKDFTTYLSEEEFHFNTVNNNKYIIVNEQVTNEYVKLLMKKGSEEEIKYFFNEIYKFNYPQYIHLFKYLAKRKDILEILNWYIEEKKINESENELEKISLRDLILEYLPKKTNEIHLNDFVKKEIFIKSINSKIYLELNPKGFLLQYPIKFASEYYYRSAISTLIDHLLENKEIFGIEKIETFVQFKSDFGLLNSSVIYLMCVEISKNSELTQINLEQLIISYIRDYISTTLDSLKEPIHFNESNELSLINPPQLKKWLLSYWNHYQLNNNLLTKESQEKHKI